MIHIPRPDMFEVRKIYKSCISNFSVRFGHNLFTII
jgi:hypothetical protein